MGNLDFNKIIEKIAEKYDLPKEQVLSDMEEAIRYAWVNGDDNNKKTQSDMFGEAMPSVSEFVDKISDELQE